MPPKTTPTRLRLFQVRHGDINLHCFTSSPGVPVLEHDGWESKLVQRPVEFADDKGQRALGLLLRPQGKRWWWLLDSNGREIRVNRYQITFLWSILGEEIREFRKADLSKIDISSNAILSLIDEKMVVKTIWSALKKEYKQAPVAGYHLARYLSRGPLLSSPLLTSFLDEATFPFSAVLILACHRYLNKETHFFKRASIHGWRCLDTATSSLHIKRCPCSLCL